MVIGRPLWSRAQAREEHWPSAGHVRDGARQVVEPNRAGAEGEDAGRVPCWVFGSFRLGDGRAAGLPRPHRRTDAALTRENENKTRLQRRSHCRRPLGGALILGPQSPAWRGLRAPTPTCAGAAGSIAVIAVKKAWPERDFRTAEHESCPSPWTRRRHRAALDAPKKALQILAPSRIEIKDTRGIQAKDITFCLLAKKRQIANCLRQIEIEVWPI